MQFFKLLQSPLVFDNFHHCRKIGRIIVACTVINAVLLDADDRFFQCFFPVIFVFNLMDSRIEQSRNFFLLIGGVIVGLLTAGLFLLFM